MNFNENDSRQEEVGEETEKSLIRQEELKERKNKIIQLLNGEISDEEGGHEDDDGEEDGEDMGEDQSSEGNEDGMSSQGSGIDDIMFNKSFLDTNRVLEQERAVLYEVNQNKINNNNGKRQQQQHDFINSSSEGDWGEIESHGLQ